MSPDCVPIQTNVGHSLRFLVWVALLVTELGRILEDNTEDDSPVQVYFGLRQERQEDVLGNAQWADVFAVAAAASSCRQTQRES